MSSFGNLYLPLPTTRGYLNSGAGEGGILEDPPGARPVRLGSRGEEAEQVEGEAAGHVEAVAEQGHRCAHHQEQQPVIIRPAPALLLKCSSISQVFSLRFHAKNYRIPAFLFLLVNKDDESQLSLRSLEIHKIMIFQAI